MTAKQPADQWAFLKSDDVLADDPTSVQAAEVAALHVEAAEPQLLDPDAPDADAEQAAARAAGPVFHFADEQPDVGEPTRRERDDSEPDLIEILESQHYLFEGEDR